VEVVEDLDTEAVEEVEDLDTEEQCRVDMWRCLSKVPSMWQESVEPTPLHCTVLHCTALHSVQVVEEGLHYLDKPDGLMG
jgi:hypothetical protein